MRFLGRVDQVAGVLAALAVLSGCGGRAAMTCNITWEVQVAPASATVNHAAAPPGNQAQFVGTAWPTAPAGCPVPALSALDYGSWSNPDPADIQISSADNSTNGTAVFEAPTNGPVTLTGTFTQFVSSPVTKTVQLICN